MSTARQIITRSLQKIGAIVKSEAPSGDELQDGLAELNSLLATWSNEELLIYARKREAPFALTGAVLSYTIGTGGDINITRPTRIVAAYVSNGGIDYEMKIIDDEAYSLITYKTITGIPEFLNFSNGFPLATIKLYPSPSAAYPLSLLTEIPLTSIASIDDVLSLPPGFEGALTSNLAIRLAPEYGQPVSADLRLEAKETLGALRVKIAVIRGVDYVPRRIAIRNIFSSWRY